MCWCSFVVEVDLFRVLVSPIDGEFDRLAQMVLVHRPVVNRRKQVSGEEIEVLRPYEQTHRIARQNVLLAHRPRVAFCINLIPNRTRSDHRSDRPTTTTKA